jgi:tRNA(Ile2) C34 agmatinyltransferase TiaS
MYVKECPKCKGKSYSASRKNWICPYCGEDLNDVEPERVKE